MKKVLYFIAGACSALTLLSAFAYSDLSPSRESYEAFQSLESRGIIAGYPDHTVRPDAFVNRAEFSKIVIKTFPHVEISTALRSEPAFIDVSKKHWFYAYVAELYRMGIALGYSGGKFFSPEKTVSRAEALKIALLRRGVSEHAIENAWLGYIQIYPEKKHAIALDVSMDHWAKKYVVYGYSTGVLDAGRMPRFRPDAPMTREEAVMLVTAVEVVPIYTPTVPKVQEVPLPPQTLLEKEQLQEDFDKFLAKNTDAFVWNGTGGATYDPIPAKTEVIPTTNPIIENKPKPEPVPDTAPVVVSPPVVKKQCTFSDQSSCSDIEKKFYSTGILATDKVSFEIPVAMASAMQRPGEFLQRVDAFQRAYENMFNMNQNGGSVQKIIALCSFKEGVTYQNHFSLTDAACPKGYMWYPAWGLAGNPIEISYDAVKDVIADHNAGYLTFGIPHELAHTFENVTKKSQYWFDSSSREAVANLWLTLAMPDVGVPIKLGNAVWKTQGDALSFYAKEYQAYKNLQLSFSSLFIDNPVASNLADKYLGIIFAKREIVTDADIMRTFRLYSTYQDSIRSIGDKDREGRVNQFIYFLSCVSGKDLSASFEQDRIPVFQSTKNNIGRCVQTTQNDVSIVAIDAGQL